MIELIRIFMTEKNFVSSWTEEVILLEIVTTLLEFISERTDELKGALKKRVNVFIFGVVITEPDSINV